MKIVSIKTPLESGTIKALRAGYKVLLSGTVYTARDTAHRIINNMLKENNPLPFPLEGSVIYYTGPSPAPPGRVIGSAGPTTSYRMDAFTPILFKHGLKGTIGKGPRSKEVIRSMQENCAVYFGATGGAAALLSQCIVKAQVIAFKELGPEAVFKLELKDMPLIVVNDCYGNDLYLLDSMR